MITFILLGESNQVPGIGEVMKLPLVQPNNDALYTARINAVDKVTTEYFSLFDGGEDVLSKDFDSVFSEMIDYLNKTGLDIASAREQKYGKSQEGLMGYMHHAVICRADAVRNLKLPKSGCIHFETVVYSMLSKKGKFLKDAEIYNWIPSVNGARKWKDTPWAIQNSHRLIHGEEILPVPPKFN